MQFSNSTSLIHQWQIDKGHRQAMKCNMRSTTIEQQALGITKTRRQISFPKRGREFRRRTNGALCYFLFSRLSLYYIYSLFFSFLFLVFRQRNLSPFAQKITTIVKFCYCCWLTIYSNATPLLDRDIFLLSLSLFLAPCLASSSHQMFFYYSWINDSRFTSKLYFYKLSPGFPGIYNCPFL